VSRRELKEGPRWNLLTELLAAVAPGCGIAAVIAQQPLKIWLALTWKHFANCGV
jgi:hypothetical protein